MAKKKRKKDQPDNKGFDLGVPSGNMANEPVGDRPLKEEPTRYPKPAGATPDDGDYKQMAWRGFEEEEEDPDPMVQFTQKSEREESEMDMTPMVDVTFLLLIFFMVTASFTIQKSIEQPPVSSDEPSMNVEDREDEDDYVEIVVDQANTYYVTSREEEQVECPSEREMRARLRDAKQLAGATRLIIRAHVDSHHKKVVTAWDAGIAAGMERIEIKTTDEDF